MTADSVCSLSGTAVEVGEIAAPEALRTSDMHYWSAHTLMEIVRRRQKAGAGLRGMSLVGKKVGPVPSDI